MTDLPLTIAGMHLRISSDSEALLAHLAARYAAFAGGAPAGDADAYPVRLNPDLASRPHHHPAPPADFEGDQIIFDLPGYRGRIDPGRGAELEIASAAPVWGADYFLRVALSALAERSGGLMLHAAGIVRNERAYLFFGRSGSGKTTAARNASGGLVLNDDLVVLLPENGRWIVWGTPFTNDSQTAPAAGRAPAAALLRLVQSAQVSVEPLEGARAVAELLACVPVLNASPAPPLDRCREILLAVPAFDLRLRPDPSFWELIDRLDPQPK